MKLIELFAIPATVLALSLPVFAVEGVESTRVQFAQVAALDGPAGALGTGMRAGILAAFAEAVGAPVSLAADEGAKAKLRALTEEAIGRGVFGVPTFAAPTENGHELFWGVDAFDMLKAWLADGTMFSREPYAHLDGIEVGIRRK